MALPIQPGLPDAAQAGPERDANAGAQAREAAQQFEGLLLRELLKILRKTAPDSTLSGSGFSGQMYTQMMDDALAESLSKAGGVGLAPILEQSFGVNSDEPDLRTRMTAAERYGSLVGTVRRPALPQYRAPEYTTGATGRFQQAAELLMASGAATRWSREGQLTEADLASDFATPRSDGTAHFNVRDAAGYAGHYKCNLFAFELARRAGFQVPVVGRPRGLGLSHSERRHCGSVFGHGGGQLGPPGDERLCHSACGRHPARAPGVPPDRIRGRSCGPHGGHRASPRH